VSVRVRTDFEAERAECPKGGCFAVCELPEDCPFCERWVCNRCERVVPWGNGGADDAPRLCDECWDDVCLLWSDPCLRDPVTTETLKAERAEAVALAGRVGVQFTIFTCDVCPRAARCNLAFDLYNTDGDCLASK